MTTIKYLDLKEIILEKIKQNGGWVNCHAHIDRAYTLTEKNFEFTNKFRHEKWVLNDELRKTSTVEMIYDRMAMAIEKMLEQGVYAIATYIDVDCNTKDKAIKASQKIRERYGKDIIIKYLNQSSYGLFNEERECRKWFEIGAEYVDMIGGLLKADKGREEEHLDILLSTAKRLGKQVQIHVDELNTPEEKETEILCKKIIEHGMERKVAAIHAISINAHDKDYREYVYDLAKKAELKFISCPVAWLGERRSEDVSPIHNPLTPVDELLPKGFTVAIGTDNIKDIWMPYTDGDMWIELRTLLECARLYDPEELVKIATVNGRKVLGIE